MTEMVNTSEICQDYEILGSYGECQAPRCEIQRERTLVGGKWTSVVRDEQISGKYGTKGCH